MPSSDIKNLIKSAKIIPSDSLLSDQIKILKTGIPFFTKINKNWYLLEPEVVMGLPLSRRLYDLSLKKAICISSNKNLDKILDTISKSKTDYLLIKENGKIVGYISRKDVMYSIFEKNLKNQISYEYVEEILSKGKLLLLYFNAFYTKDNIDLKNFKLHFFGKPLLGYKKEDFDKDPFLWEKILPAKNIKIIKNFIFSKREKIKLIVEIKDKTQKMHFLEMRLIKNINKTKHQLELIGFITDKTSEILEMKKNQIFQKIYKIFAENSFKKSFKKLTLLFKKQFDLKYFDIIFLKNEKSEGLFTYKSKLLEKKLLENIGKKRFKFLYNNEYYILIENKYEINKQQITCKYIINKKDVEEFNDLIERISSIIFLKIEKYLYENYLKQTNENLIKDLYEKNREFEIFNNILKNINYQLEYREIFYTIVKELKKIIHFDLASFILFEKEPRCITFLQKNVTNELCQEKIKFLLKKLKKYNKGLPLKEPQILKIHISKNNSAISAIKNEIFFPIYINKKNHGIFYMGSQNKNPMLLEKIGLIKNIINISLDSLEKLKKTLANNEIVIESIFDKFPMGIVIINNKYEFLFANKEATKYIKDLINIKREKVINKFGDKKIEDLIKFTQKYEYNNQLSYNLVKGMDGKKMFRVYSKKFKPGKSTNFLLIIDDITIELENKKRMEQSKRLSSVGRLAAGIAHDFNNILTSILGIVELRMLEKKFTEKTIEKDYKIIKEQVFRATDLIKQILDFSRETPIKYQLFNISQFLFNINKILKRTIPESVKIKIDVKNPNIYIKGDASQIHQVVINLAVNAKDAMEKSHDKSFYISCEKIELKREKRGNIVDIPPGKWVKLRFSDTGTGIKEKDIAKIFAPFYTTKGPEKGTGLGLSQVYGIVKKHNGYIDMKNNLDRGVTFDIYLPFAKEKTYELRKVEKKELPQNKPKMAPDNITLLLVEDEKLIREGTKKILQVIGFNVISAKNGLEGLKIFRNNLKNIDIIITDMVMPEMNGEEFSKRAKDLNPDIKIIGTTGFPLDSNSIPKTFDDWLLKPYNINVLKEKILSFFKQISF